MNEILLNDVELTDQTSIIIASSFLDATLFW